MSVIDSLRSASRCSPGSAVARMVFPLVLLFVSCAAEPVVLKCSHRDIVSMGPENGFRIKVVPDDALTLKKEADRMDVAFTLVPPIVGPVALIQTVDGTQVARWELKVGPGSGISTRCRIGMTPALSTCGAAITDPPHSIGGDWSIEPGGNRVLEAGLSFRVCR